MNNSIQPKKQQDSRVASRSSKKIEKKKKIKKRILLSFTIFISLLIILIATFIWSVYNEIDKSLETISLAPQVTIDVDTQEEVPIVIPQEESVKEKALTMVLLGLDSRTGGGGINSDVIILATFNPETKKGYVISMPRDTKVSYTVDGKTRTQKVNGVYAEGYNAARQKGAERNESILSGMQYIKTALSDFYEVDISYVTTVGFKGFTNVIDTLGGVDVYVDMNMNYEDSIDGTNINLTKGQQVLKGKQALDFVRFRQTNANANASSDFERNERQAQVVKAMLKKLVSLNGLSKINTVIEQVAEDVNTDMPTSELEDIIKTYFTINLDNITFTSLAGNWKNPYVYPDEEALKEAKQMIQTIITE